MESKALRPAIEEVFGKTHLYKGKNQDWLFLKKNKKAKGIDGINKGSRVQSPK